ncbi:MAG: resuscitation-promoting factor RpfB [Frankiaceae bacterium]|jgi:uncharacterized protein YabE (DUF348 family)|nr:resuscitation-promoting factor RpfB [Frankiaceae bacterium]
MRKTPVALAVYAGVIIGMAGTTTAFASLDKTVTITVDGQSKQVRTFARDVGGLLARQHLKVGAHDTVAPRGGTKLTEGSKVVVRHGRQLALTIDGRQRTVWTTALTVDEALSALGVRADGAFFSADRSSRVPLSGLSLELRLPHRVTVLHDGKATRVTTTAATVVEVLHQAKVIVASTDKVSIPRTTRPTEGMQIRIIRVRQPVVSDTRPISFQTRTVRDKTMYRGTRKVVSAGVPGIKVFTFKLTVVDGVVKSRTLVSTKVARRAVDKVVRVGTKTRPGYGPNIGGAVDNLNWYALAGCESGHNPRAVSPKGYYGLYQFSLSTWHSVGGHGNPTDYSSNEQTYRAKLLYRNRGASPWPVCGSRLYS